MFGFFAGEVAPLMFLVGGDRGGVDERRERHVIRVASDRQRDDPTGLAGAEETHASRVDPRRAAGRFECAVGVGRQEVEVVVVTRAALTL